MTDKSIIIKGYDISNQILHGLTPDQYIELLEYQDFKCWLSGLEFYYSEEEKKFIEKSQLYSLKIAPAIDHDHNSGIIRSILNKEINGSEGAFWGNPYQKFTDVQMKILKIEDYLKTGDFKFFSSGEKEDQIHRIYEKWDEIIAKLEDLNDDITFILDFYYPIKSFDGKILEIYMQDSTIRRGIDFKDMEIIINKFVESDEYKIIHDNLSLIEKVVSEAINDTVQVKLVIEVDESVEDGEKCFFMKQGKPNEYNLGTSQLIYNSVLKHCDSVDEMILSFKADMYCEPYLNVVKDVYGYSLHRERLIEYYNNPPAKKLFGHIKFK